MNHPRFVLFTICIASIPALHAQEPSSVLPPAPRVETSVSLGAGAQLTTTRVSTDFQNIGVQSFDPSATVLGSIRQSISPWLGYSANFGYTRSTEQNRGIAAFYNLGSFAIPTNAYEASLAYLFQKRLSPKLTGFADIGGGILGFLPVHRGDTAANFVPGKQRFLVPSYQTRPLGVAAVGLDLRLTQRLDFRAEYRGLLFKFPDWSNGSVAKNLTETNQPTVSLVYRFSGKPARPRVGHP